MRDTDWDIGLEGRAWRKQEIRQRYDLSPERIELIEGRLFLSEEHRVRMLGLLLENVGAERAVQLGDPKIWRAAVAKLDDG